MAAATAGAEEVVQLIGAGYSPLTTRVRVLFALKGVEHQFLEEKYGEKSELLLKSNPVYKKMPVLVHNGKPICESMIILEYINDVWAAGSIFPSDPYDLAIARFWAVYIDDTFFSALRSVVRGETQEVKKEGIEKTIAGLMLLEEVFKERSKGNGFFGGDTIGSLDIVLGCFLGWFKAYEHVDIAGTKVLDETKIPLLVSWAERFCLDDAVKKVMPTTETLVEFFKVVQAARKTAGDAN